MSEVGSRWPNTSAIAARGSFSFPSCTWEGLITRKLCFPASKGMFSSRSQVVLGNALCLRSFASSASTPDFRILARNKNHLLGRLVRLEGEKPKDRIQGMLAVNDLAPLFIDSRLG